MIVILHGWSDDSASLVRLAEAVAAMRPASQVVPLYLGDYTSMDDDVDFDDLANAMQQAWSDSGLPTAARSVDVIVHSTGALVARHWMTLNYEPETNPIRRLVMLAPANFGSHLAHKGASFLARVVKGYKAKRMFHTGAKILQGLELASEFSTRLAMVDRFDPDKRWYGSGRVLATALVGTRGYSGIAAAANTPGSDGTVLVSTANLNPARLSVDFATDPLHPKVNATQPFGRTAFCRIPNENHSTIAFKDHGPANPITVELIQRALSVDDDGFDAHCDAVADLSERHRLQEADGIDTAGYQNTVLHVADNQSREVGDYFVEFFVKRSGVDNEDKPVTARIQREALREVHINKSNSARRSLKFDCGRLASILQDAGRPLHMSITASPEVSSTGSVGYRTIAYNDIGSVTVKEAGLSNLFVADRTLLVDLSLRRIQEPGVMRFKRLKK